MEFKPIRVRTIIFTESCPLDCKYCDPKNDECYKQDHNMTEKELNELVDLYDKIDNVNIIDTRLTFSGGEPFLYWSWIKKIIEKYQNRFLYEFNTSGYLLTEEIIEFLSHYKVNFLLSVDGNERLTNYLRPVKASPYHTGYYKTLIKIIPTLLYYFPNTPYKMIINARYVDLLYDMYLNANELGFKYFTFIIDFGHRRENNKDFNKWTSEHTQILKQQVDLIIQEQLMGFVQGINKTEVLEFNRILSFLFKDIKEFKPEHLACQLFNARSLTSLHDTNPNDIKHCLSKDFPDLNILHDILIKEFEKTNNHCLKDNQCEAYLYCALNCCPQRGYLYHSGFFDFDDLECYVNQASYEGVIKFLSIGNELLANNLLYKNFILKQMEGGI